MNGEDCCSMSAERCCYIAQSLQLCGTFGLNAIGESCTRCHSDDAWWLRSAYNLSRKQLTRQSRIVCAATTRSSWLRSADELLKLTLHG